ncbi:MAG: Uma2 family endonuclease [Eubacteriaceae bacterium]|nr:Uma2 family endonuclease [Eubacteriaceae bacterium]
MYEKGLNGYEIIDGVAYEIESAPSPNHQRMCSELNRQIANFLYGKPAYVFGSPFEVYLLSQDKKSESLLKPDLTVICDLTKIDDKGCNGAPDLVVEVSSQFTQRTDRLVKYQKYLEFGVKEYWIVDPDAQLLQVFIYNKEINMFVSGMYNTSDHVPVAILDGCVINMHDVFGA